MDQCEAVGSLMDSLLNILADGEYHSGEQLGEKLGISRAAVWKQVQKLVDAGLQVESQKGCGYRIPGGLDLLNAEALEQQLDSCTFAIRPRLSLYSTITSTNELAREAAAECNETGLVILAEQQTEGRGRRGRKWVSPLGRNIYLSIVWGFEGGVQVIEGLSLAVGVAVRRALVNCGVDALAFKWPNDLLWENKKLGGILLEVLGDPAGFCQVVVGVGLNLNMTTSSGGSIDQPWADISQISSAPISRNQLSVSLVKELFDLLVNYQQRGFGAYRDEWKKNDAFDGKGVTLSMLNKSLQGIARGVDDRGALLIEIDGALQSFSGGEISMRGSDDR